MKEICCVCSEPLDPDNMSQCNLCGGHFHMAWSTEALVKECGHYWINENCLGLAFICNHCEEHMTAKEY